MTGTGTETFCNFKTQIQNFNFENIVLEPKPKNHNHKSFDLEKFVYEYYYEGIQTIIIIYLHYIFLYSNNIPVRSNFQIRFELSTK